MRKLTPSAKRLQRNRDHAVMHRRQIVRARRYEESCAAHAASIAKKGGLERKMDDAHKPKEESA